MTKKKAEKVPEAETLAELKAWAEKLKPEERNAKPLGFKIHQATERIVGQVVPL